MKDISYKEMAVIRNKKFREGKHCIQVYVNKELSVKFHILLEKNCIDKSKLYTKWMEKYIYENDSNE